MEFKLLGFIGVPITAISYGALYIPGVAQWRMVIVMTGFNAFFAIMVIYPLVLTYRQEISKSSSLTSSHNTSGSDDNSSKDLEMQPIDSIESHFPNFPQISAFLRHPEAVESVEDFIVHTQDFKGSRLFSFWKEMVVFHKIQVDQYRVGKAYLLFQKFLNKDALLEIDSVPDSIKQDLQAKLLVATEQVELKEGEVPVKISVSFFDEATRIMESVMAEELFPRYFKSAFFQEYKKSMRLKEGLNITSGGQSLKSTHLESSSSVHM